MASTIPLSSSDINAYRIAERQVDAQLRARREGYALVFTRYATWFCTALSLLLFGAWFLARSYPQLLVFAGLILMLALGTALYPILQRRQRADAGFSLVCSLALIVITLSPLLLPGLLPMIGITNIVAVMIITIFLGKRASRWLVGAFILAYLVDVVVVALLGWRFFPPLELQTELWLTGAINLGSTLVQILVVRRIVLGLEQQFRRAQRFNLALERHMQTLNETQATLKHERTLLRTLIDAVPANVYIKDRHSCFVEANIQTALQMGLETPSELIGKTDFDFFSEEFAKKYFADEQAVIQSGQPLLNIEEINFDFRIQQQSWFLTSKVPIVNEQGEVTGLAGVGLDIRARKETEEALQQQRDLLAAQARANDEMRQFLQSTLDAFPAITVVLDRDGSILLVNQPWTQFADENGGQSSSHYLGSNYLSVCDSSLGPRSEEAEPAADGIRAVIEGQQDDFYLEYPCPSPSENRWFGMRVSPFAEPVPRRVVVAHINITERKQAEEALRESQAKLQTFFEVLPVGVSVLNHEGQIVDMNPALARILDISREGLMRGAYRSRQNLASDGSPLADNELPGVRARVEPQPVHDVIVGVVKEDATTVWTSVSATRLPGAHADVLMVTVDITERKQAEAQAFALAAEQQRSRLLRAFINDISHDFRTPLTIIGTSAYLVSKTTDSAKLSRHSEHIEAQVARLTNLMDSFVELVELEQQASALQFQPVELDALLKVIIERSQPEAQAKRQRLEYRNETDSTCVLANSAALTKAIHNIVANAIHYTPDEGSITLCLCRVGDDLVITVTDTGIGIPVEDLPHLFESFYRVDSARAAESGGAGLGLSMAKKVIELMNGQIEVESEVGKGSVFKLYLPSVS